MTTDRPYVPRIQYVVWWLTSAGKILEVNPDDVLHEHTHINYSGGSSGWESSIDVVYFEPCTIEERMLQGEIHEILLTALHNALSAIERPTRKQVWSIDRQLDLSEAWRISEMIKCLDPIHAVRVQILLNRLCVRYLGKGLHSTVRENFSRFMFIAHEEDSE